ncbi:nucleoid-associated protein [Gilvimarinus agarilyticus]|uniref:nucleoid-associated protein n=1 Tax=Reichenbachiella agariperforans TaxID=156994 RepID=UPI001C098BBD|nr:nucleoid-associated protein [Reichenbachiella agariperforans]MBU2884863.1 nucleoid-associated protein [Gilvimarinus agarilyticus]MBU2914156.1 nucleoid-associated protein [Reichenbachiella agariperforans]
MEEKEGIVFTSLHYIDHVNNKISKKDISNQGTEALAEYINKLIEDIKLRASKRTFQFQSETTEVRRSLSNFFNEEYSDATEINAMRLLRSEISAQQAIDHLGVSIQKGSLFQAIVNLDARKKLVIIAKADHDTYLDEESYEVREGLPWTKKIFKSFFITINSDEILSNVVVSDSNEKVAEYWWKTFLELEVIRTSSENTKRMLGHILRPINRIKKDFPADYEELRNAVLGYFQSHSDFSLDHLISTIFDRYDQVNPSLDYDQKIKSKIDLISKKTDVDTLFDIDRQEVKQRRTRKLGLNTGIELVLKEYNKQNITATVDEENNKYIQIRSDLGYNTFSK